MTHDTICPACESNDIDHHDTIITSTGPESTLVCFECGTVFLDHPETDEIVGIIEIV